MTPSRSVSDLPAQIRALREEISPTAGEPLDEWDQWLRGRSSALRHVTNRLDAILEAQPPETAQAPPCALCNGTGRCVSARCLQCDGTGIRLSQCSWCSAKFTGPHPQNGCGAAPTPDPPAETPTLEPEKTRVENRAFMAALVAETPTGLAPLITEGMTESTLLGYQECARDPDTPLDATVVIFGLLWELDAQRHARAAERREAIEECVHTLRAYLDTWIPESAQSIGITSALRVLEVLRLRDQPRVSPVPPSGGAK